MFRKTAAFLVITPWLRQCEVPKVEEESLSSSTLFCASSRQGGFVAKTDGCPKR